MIKKFNNNFQFGIYTPNPEITLKPLQKKLGFHIPIVLIFSPWGMSWKSKMTPFPTKLCSFISTNKSIPFIKWEPAKWTKTPNKMINDYPLKKMISGDFDPYIKDWAKQAKAFKKTIWLSFGHEMNGSWYHWADKPDLYRSALLHIYSMFKKMKVKNVRWVFCVNNYPIDYIKHFPSELNKNKDIIIGIDGYNADGIWGLKWKPFKYIFEKPYNYVLKNFPGKKIIIGELGCASNGGNKSVWTKGAFASIDKDFPKISALVWFNINKEADWRLIID